MAGKLLRVRQLNEWRDLVGNCKTRKSPIIYRHENITVTRDF